MKIYTSTFDLAYPSNARFWVAPNSDFKIGLKITNKGADYAGNFALKSGSTTFTPDASKTAGFTTYTTKSLGTGAVTYEVDVPGAQQKFTLMQIVTDSTVFEVGSLSGGGDVPADVATKTWVNEQISDFITEDDLTGYATQDELLDKADISSLTAYATASDLSDVALSAGDALTAIADINDTQLPAIREDVGECVVHKAEGIAPDILNMTAVYESDWETLSADPDINTFYVVLPDPVTP